MVWALWKLCHIKLNDIRNTWKYITHLSSNANHRTIEQVPQNNPRKLHRNLHHNLGQIFMLEIQNMLKSVNLLQVPLDKR